MGWTAEWAEGAQQSHTGHNLFLVLCKTCGCCGNNIKLIRDANMIIGKRRRGVRSESGLNIDVTRACFLFSPPEFVVLYLCFTSLPRACYSSIFGLYIMDAEWASRGGVWLGGLRARVREGNRSTESSRLAQSLIQGLAAKQKGEVVCPSEEKRRKSWLTVAKPLLVRLAWHGFRMH